MLVKAGKKMAADLKKLNPVWLKASVLGAMWASSEIILGSFFHNLRIPFSSIILTGIGIMLLVTVSHRWNERGLIWRAGLICAIMKSISPSAVIFGPMIAIFLESLLMQLSVTLLGKNPAGYLAGGILAMSWNLVQKVVNLLIFYGLNIVGLYTSLVEYANRQLGGLNISGWTPVLFLLALYGAFGIVAAGAGILAGRAASADVSSLPPGKGDTGSYQPRKGEALQRYSFGWLGFTIAGLIAILALMNFTGYPVWLITGCILLSLWVSRYHGILRPLGKPKFWIIFFLITMLSSLIWARVREGMEWTDGLIAGLEMNFRAAVMMIGFSVIGKELSNPVIRDFFLRTSFRRLPLALEAAFDTLPFTIAWMPPLKSIYRHPLQAMRKFGSGAETWLEQIQIDTGLQPKVVIIHGTQGCGKSTLMEQLAIRLKDSTIATSGFVSPVIIEDGVRKGYMLKDLAGGRIMQLSGIEPIPGADRYGTFYFFPEALEYGRAILKRESLNKSGIIFIDEIGPLEFSGKGWSDSLSVLLADSGIRIILSVRDNLVDAVVQHWSITEPLFIDPNVFSPEDAFQNIVVFFNQEFSG